MSEERLVSSEDDGKNHHQKKTGKLGIGGRNNTTAHKKCCVFNYSDFKFTAAYYGRCCAHYNRDHRRGSVKNVRATVVDRDDILRILAKDATPGGNFAVVGAKPASDGQRALDSGKRAFGVGQTDKALLYFIYGVNHDGCMVCSSFRYRSD